MGRYDERRPRNSLQIVHNSFSTKGDSRSYISQGCRDDLAHSFHYMNSGLSLKLKKEVFTTGYKKGFRLSWACRKQISRPLFYLKVKGKGSVQALAHNGRLAWVFVFNVIHHIKEYVYSRSGELVMRKGLAATVLSSHSLSSGERHPDIYSQCVPAAQSHYGIV